ncbi:NUDIX domain-containing protein [Halobacterium yunchengense]|uniref:NUDIX domain-containing protein n=1 Tax=Halobacterium yunchengense TaxID=3108497 RepID=UPI0030090E0E
MPDSPSTARCVVRRGDELLVEESVDPEDGRAYVPPGGALPPGGDPEAAVREAFADVLDATLTDLEPLGTFDGTRVYEGGLEESWPHTEEGFTLYDPETGETGRVCWLHVDDFRKYGETLRPDGLLDALDGARDAPADA